MFKRKIPPVPLSPDGISKFMPPAIVSDPNGSYTGVPMDPEERPIQDADDL